MKVKKRRMKKVLESVDVPADKDLAANLTGGQVQEVLDFLLIESLTPLVVTSEIFDLQIIYLLGLTAKNKKRKLSALPREEFITSMCHSLITNDREKKINILAQSKIERGFIYNFIVNFLSETDGYVELYQKYLVAFGAEKIRLDLKLKTVEQSVGSTRGKLFSTINTARDYLGLAYEFRNSIVSNYVKFAYKQAKAFCSMKGSNFDFQDVYQNFLAAITKAVDKYDSSKGALTSYINYWILNAQTCPKNGHGHEYGVAYSVPQLRKKQMALGDTGDANFSVSLEQVVGQDGEESELKDYLVGEEGVDKKVIEQEHLNKIRYLIKCADIKGCARLYMDLDEVFSKKEIRLMKKNMIQQLGDIK